MSGSVVGATGAVYTAIRKDLYQQLPYSNYFRRCFSTEHHYAGSIVFSTWRTLAYDTISKDVYYQVWKRKVRTLAGNCFISFKANS